MLNNANASLCDSTQTQAEVPAGWFSQYISSPVSSALGFLFSNISDIENSYALSQYVKGHFQENTPIDLNNVRAHLLDRAKAEEMKLFVERMKVSLNLLGLSDMQESLIERLTTTTVEELQALNDDEQLTLARLKNRFEETVANHNILNTQYSYMGKLAKMHGIRTMSLLSPLSLAYQDSVESLTNIIRYKHQGRYVHAQEAFYNGALSVIPPLLAAGTLTAIEAVAPTFVTCLGGYPLMVVSGLATVATAMKMHKNLYNPKKSLFQHRDEKIAQFKSNLKKGLYNEALLQSVRLEEQDQINVFDLELIALVQESDLKTVQTEYTDLLKSGIRASISQQGSQNDSLIGYAEKLLKLNLLKQKDIKELCETTEDSILSKIEEFIINFEQDTFETRSKLLNEIYLFIKQQTANEWVDPILDLIEDHPLIKIRDYNTALINVDKFNNTQLESLYEHYAIGFKSEKQSDFVEEALFTLHCLDQNTPSDERDGTEIAFLKFLQENIPLEAFCQLRDQILQSKLSINKLAFDQVNSILLHKALKQDDIQIAYQALKSLKFSEAELTLGLQALQNKPQALQEIRFLASSNGEGILCSHLDVLLKKTQKSSKTMMTESPTTLVAEKKSNKKFV